MAFIYVMHIKKSHHFLVRMIDKNREVTPLGHKKDKNMWT